MLLEPSTILRRLNKRCAQRSPHADLALKTSTILARRMRCITKHAYARPTAHPPNDRDHIQKLSTGHTKAHADGYIRSAPVTLFHTLSYRPCEQEPSPNPDTDGFPELA